MRHCFNGGFIYRQLFGFSLWRQEKAEPFVAAGYFCFEGLSFGIGAPQESIPGSAGFILSDEHGVVVFGALIEDSCPDAGFDYFMADPALEEICEHPAVVFCCRWQKEFLRLFRLGNRRDIAWDFFTKGRYRIHKLHSFYLNKIIKGAFSADITAFPMPEAGSFVDFKAVMFSQLELSTTFSLD